MNPSGAAQVWQVFGTGEGFLRNGAPASFELSGFVRADDPNVAWARAIEIARSRWLELGRAVREEAPRVVINPEEIVDASRLKLDPAEIDEVKIAWEDESGDE